MSGIEEQAWTTEPPRGGQILSVREQFRRESLAWVGAWLRRAKNNPQRESAKPFAIVLCDESRLSPALDPHLVGKSTLDEPMRAYSCPMPFGIVITTANLRSAKGYTMPFDTAADVLRFLRGSDLRDRFALIVDPGQLGYGLYDPSFDISDFEVIVPELGSEPIVLSTTRVDELLTKFHEMFVRLPNKKYGVQFWEDEQRYKPDENAEKEVQRSLMQFFLTLLHDTRFVTTFTEVHVPSGRVDVTLISSSSAGLRFYFLELKVLREADGPSKRERLVRTCIAQARARQGDAPETTEATFACCYDASKNQAQFTEPVQQYADEPYAVMLRRYPVLNAHYVVPPSS